MFCGPVIPLAAEPVHESRTLSICTGDDHVGAAALAGATRRGTVAGLDRRATATMSRPTRWRPATTAQTTATGPVIDQARKTLEGGFKGSAQNLGEPTTVREARRGGRR